MRNLYKVTQDDVPVFYGSMDDCLNKLREMHGRTSTALRYGCRVMPATDNEIDDRIDVLTESAAIHRGANILGTQRIIDELEGLGYDEYGRELQR